MRKSHRATGDRGSLVVDAARQPSGRRDALRDPSLDQERRQTMKSACAARASMVFYFAAAAAVTACGSGTPSQTATFTREALMDPATCQKCHAQYFKEW